MEVFEFLTSALLERPGDPFEEEIMRYHWNDIPALLRTPIGRKQLIIGLYHRAWPILSLLAMYYRRTLLHKTFIVTIVGSFGKTTTTRAVYRVLCGQEKFRFGHNAWSSVALAVLRIRPDDRHTVIEIGIEGPGQMTNYAQMIHPNMTVVTSIGSEHNRSLRTLEETRKEKSEMLRMLPPSGFAVLNGDDPNVRWMATQTQARVVTFGLGKDNEVRASDIILDWPKGTKFKLHAWGEVREMDIQLIGRVMVYPILAAIAVALLRGLPLDQTLSALETFPPSPGRLEPIRLSNGAFILCDDFKSSLETIDAALDVFSEIPAERRIIVLGDVSEPPGSTGPIYRHIGERVAKITSKAIFISESKKHIKDYVTGAKRGGLALGSMVKVHRNVLKVVEILQEDLRLGDVILIKGRGNQQLDRITLALSGKTVRCNISFCNVRTLRCEDCPMLGRGWDGLRVVV
jgi:UDP-N-acetylmuramoyl-tripeptide--D-alanyl-D-alanine ligase